MIRPIVCASSIPDISSHTSDLARYGIVISQFHRFCSIIKQRSNFIHAVALHAKGISEAAMQEA